MALGNGDKIIFHTEPESTATVIGTFEQLGSYGLLFEDGDVRKLTVEQFEEGLTDGLIRMHGTPRKRQESTRKPPKGAVTGKKAPVTPPWAK